MVNLAGLEKVFVKGVSLYIDWGLKSGGILFTKRVDAAPPSDFLAGVTKLAAIYSSSNFLIKQTYTSIFEDETTK